MKFTYCMRCDTVCDEEKNVCTVYGIDAMRSDGKVLSSYADVFFDRQQAECFVNMCNEGKLALIHLSSVIEDALA